MPTATSVSSDLSRAGTTANRKMQTAEESFRPSILMSLCFFQCRVAVVFVRALLCCVCCSLIMMFSMDIAVLFVLPSTCGVYHPCLQGQPVVQWP